MGQKIIALLDTNPTIQKIIELAFIDTGYQIISLNVDLPSVDDTLEKVRNIAPNMILLDLDLPGVGGKDVCKKLKEDPSLRHLPVILLVRELPKHSPEKLQQCGADKILGKPFHTEDLIRLVDEYLNHDRKQGRSGRNQPNMTSELTKWFRKIIEEKLEETIRQQLEELVADRLEQFFQGEDFLRSFQTVFMSNQNEVFQHLMTNSERIIEHIAVKVVPEQAKIIIQREIDRIKNGGG
jgi:DNA-binding response OmpR family regulator